MSSGTAVRRTSIARSVRLQAARDFVARNLHRDDLKPELVARALHISVRQLHLLFKPTGMSFSRHVLSRRLERARVMLEAEPDRKVIAIALECGIGSLTVFYRGFRALYGVSPTRYRRSLRQADSARPRPAASDQHSDAAAPVG